MREKFLDICDQYYVKGESIDTPFFFEYYLNKEGEVKDINEFNSAFQTWVLRGGKLLLDEIMHWLCIEFEIVFIKKGDKVLKVL